MQSNNMEENDPEERGEQDSGSVARDGLFDPSIDVLLNDFDDERTLDEEEALAAEEPQDQAAELSTLQRESDMPLDELLALYGYEDANQENENPDREAEEEKTTEIADEIYDQDTQPWPPEEHSDLTELYEPIGDEEESTRVSRDPIATLGGEGEEEDADYDYNSDAEELRMANKTIMVGSDYQAEIPEELSTYDDAGPHDYEDKLLWNPYEIDEEETKNFLKKSFSITKPSLGAQVHNEEQALAMLQQCGHNGEEALKNLKSLPSSSPCTKDPMWFEEEFGNFDPGARSNGKNFLVIQQNKTIMVGTDYQAQIPDGLSPYDDAGPNENEDKLVWNPNAINEESIELYLKQSLALTKPAIPTGIHLRDNEEALKSLHQSGYNEGEALKLVGTTAPASAPANESRLFEEECRNFEPVVQSRGNIFSLLQQNKD